MFNQCTNCVFKVGFHQNKQVHKVHVEKRLNEIVNRLNKTKVERTDVDLRAEREERDRKEREDKKAMMRQQRKLQEEADKERMAEQEARSYDRIMHTEQMRSNKDGGSDSDDFM